jgi:ABC-2 type transport system permease protein
MTALTPARALPAAKRAKSNSAQQMPFVLQVTTLAWRALRVTFRTPAAILPSLVISVFFLAVYQASLGNASGFLPGLVGKSYIGFILPVSIVSAALSSSGVAGSSIVRDIENGYFDKLSLTPISRGALVLGPMLAGAAIVVLQTLLVTTVGILMGLRPETGIAGLLVMVGYALLLGMSFAGLTVGVALRTGNAGAVQGASFLFFPLSFLTATFVPFDLLSGWIKVAATYNPITYVLDAMRTLMLTGWDAEILARGLSSCLVLAVITYSFAILSLRARTRRK